MKPYDKIKPNYVREWLVEKKQKWLKLMDDRIAQAKRHNLIPEESKMPVRISTKDQLRAMGINVNFSDNDLNGSFGDASTGAADDDFDVE